jgi:uncharacterized protein (TIGR03086 family)
MAEVAERFRNVAAAFTERVAAVPDDRWDAPAPCEGWVARDVVRHLVEWLPDFFHGRAGLPRPEVPSVDDDPLGAWAAVRDSLQAALDDPEVAGREFDTGMGAMTVADAMAGFGVGDVLVHTWDLARAAGLDERLDEGEVARIYAQMQPMDEMLRGPMFGPKVPVPDDADAQAKLLAFTGRTP